MNPAEQRAERLLLEHLDEKQRQSYRETGAFKVRGSAGGKYRIVYTGRGHVHELGLADRLLYVRTAYFSPRAMWPYTYPSASFPVQDQMLALKMFVEADEPGFRRLSCSRYPERYDRDLAMGALRGRRQ